MRRAKSDEPPLAEPLALRNRRVPQIKFPARRNGAPMIGWVAVKTRLQCWKRTIGRRAHLAGILVPKK